MQASKLSLPFAGTTMLDRAICAALSSRATHVAVITGAHRVDISPLVSKHPAVDEIINTAFAMGQSTSIQCAVNYCRALGSHKLILMVADQPFVYASDIDALIEAHRTSKANAYITASEHQQGNPCLFTEACFDDLLSLTGDQGARAVFSQWTTDNIVLVRSINPLVHEDADTQSDFARLEKIYLQHKTR